MPDLFLPSHQWVKSLLYLVEDEKPVRSGEGMTHG